MPYGAVDVVNGSMFQTVNSSTVKGSMVNGSMLNVSMVGTGPSIFFELVYSLKIT